MPEGIYIRIRGQVHGPFDAERLQVLARRGRFSRLHEVSTDGRNWTRASEHPELFPGPPPRKIRRTSAALSVPAGGILAAGTDDASADAELLPPEPLASSAELWHYTQAGLNCRPLPFSELRTLAQAGQLQADDLVWTDGMEDWTPARDVPELWGPAGPTFRAPATRSGGTADSRECVRTAPMAAAGLVCGLLGVSLLPVLGSILGVVFGHAALGQLRRDRQLGGRGMAVAGLILGYSVLMVLGVAGLVIGLVYLLYGKLPQLG